MNVIKYCVFSFILVFYCINPIYATVFDSIESESLLHSNLSSTFDESSLFFNPTVISKSKMYELHSKDKSFSSLSIISSFSQKSSPFYSIISATSSESVKDLFKDESFQKSSFLLLKQMQIKDSYYFTLGLFSKALVHSMNLESGSSTNEIIYESDSWNKYIHSLSDSGVVLNIPIISYENRINMALGIWGVYRSGITMGVSEEIDTEEIKQFFNRGFMYGADLGIGYVFNDFWSPSISVVMANISGKCVENYLDEYDDRKVCGAALIEGSIKDPSSYNIIEPTNLKVGASINPRFSKNFSVRFNSTLENIHVAMGENNYFDPSRDSFVSSSFEVLFGNPFKDTPFTLAVAFNKEAISYSAKIKISRFSLNFSHIEEEHKNVIPSNLKNLISEDRIQTEFISKYLIGMDIKL